MSSKNRAIGESERMEYGSFSGTCTPSPFPPESIASTRLSTLPTLLYLSNLILRCFALLVCFLAALALALAASPASRPPCSAFPSTPTYRYCLSIVIVSLIYSALQLFKGICDIAFRGLLVSEKISDYAAFMMDQVVAYLLMSSSSTLIPFANEMVAQQCGKLAAALAGMSFCAFLAISLSALQSGYKLCKRIICILTIKKLEEKGEETAKTEVMWFGTGGPTSTEEEKLNLLNNLGTYKGGTYSR